MAKEQFGIDDPVEDQSPASNGWDFGLSDPVDGKQNLPEGVTPSTAGAGRGSSPASAYNPPAPAPRERASWEDDADQLMADTAAPSLTSGNKTSVLERLDLPADKPWSFRDASQSRREMDDERERGTIGRVIGPDASPSTIAKGLATDFVAGGKRARSGINQMAADISGVDRFADEARRERAQADTMTAMNTPEFQTDEARGVYSGISSTIQQIPSLAAGIATRNPQLALGGMVAPMVPDKYGELRERGAGKGMALAGSVANAGIEYITEKLPMGIIVDKFGKAGAKKFIADLLISEGLGEQAATIGQDAVDTAIANPDKSWGEYFAERPDAAYQTLLATVTQGAVMGGASAGTHKIKTALRDRELAGAIRDDAKDLFIPKPKDRTQQIDFLRKSGDELAAAHLERKQNQEQAAYSAEKEAGALADFGPGLQGAYKAIRATGAKTGESVSKASLQWHFEQAAELAGLSPKAQQAISDKLAEVPPEKAAAFVQKAVTGLVNNGMAQPFDGIDTLAQTIEQQRDRMMDSVLSVMDDIETMEGQQDGTQDTADAAAGQAIDSGAPEALAGEQGAAEASAIAEPALPDGQPEPSQALNEDWQQFPEQTGTLNVPRAEMPQVKNIHRGPLVNFLGARGVTSEQIEVDPAELKPTQAEFSQSKVDEAADRNTDRSILISSDNHIVDGHHQAIAKLQNGEPVKAIRLNAPAAELIPLVKEFPSSTVESTQDVQNPQAPAAGSQAQAAPVEAPANRTGDAAAASGVPAAPGSGDVQADGLNSLGRNSQPISEGGKPFKTQAEAKKEKKLHPDKRVVKSDDGKGYVLKPMTAKQIAAQAKAAKNLGGAGTRGTPLSAHEFIASRGGLDPSLMGSTLNFDKNERVGAKWLFAGKNGGGMDMGRASEALQQAGYLEVDDENAAIDLIERSIKQSPQYTPEGWERIGEAENKVQFDDYLQAQQESEEDPFASLMQDGYTEDDFDSAGFGDASEEIQAEVAALSAQLDALGVDAETIRMDVAMRNTKATDQEYYEITKSAITAAIAEASQPEGRGDSGKDDGEQGQARELRGEPVNRPERGSEERARSQPDGDGPQSLTDRPDGTLSVTGDSAALKERLTAAGIPAKSIVKSARGVVVGKTQANRARNVLEGRDADKIATRGMTYEGRPTDGKPIKAGDIFTTASGRETTPYPKQSGQKYATQWLIDNAIAEAKSRGDDFNSTAFSAEKPGKNGYLPPASGDMLHEYLFGQQPDVVPSILKPLVSDEMRAQAPQKPLQSADAPQSPTLTAPTKADIEAQQARTEQADALDQREQVKRESEVGDSSFMTGFDGDGRQDNTGNLFDAPTEAEVKTQTETAAFIKWFGDSKAVDASGKPLVLYHGTNKTEDGDAFTSFDAYGSNYGLFGQGAYFTADASVASEYTTKGRGSSPTVYAAFMSVKNPIDMDAKADPEAWANAYPDYDLDAYHEDGDTNESYYRAVESAISDEGMEKWEGAEAMQDGLRRMGYDGITHIGGGRVKSEGKKHKVFIAFDPEQIKSATGNSGAFDPANADIRFNRHLTADLFRQMNNRQQRGMAVTDVQKAIATVTSKWNNGPRINVVATTKDLPMAAPADVHGVYMSGSVYLVASNIENAKAAKMVLAHEAIAHHGLRELLGKDAWKALMNNITLAVKTGNKPLNAIKAEVRKAYVDDAGKFNLTPGQEADEIAAKVVEQAIDADGQFKPGFGFVKSVYAKIAEFLRSIGIDLKFTHAELQGLLVNAQRNLEVGKRTEGARGRTEPVFARENDGMLQTIPASPAVSNLNKVMRGAGWEIEYIDLDMTGEKPKVAIRVNRDDGRFLIAKVDSVGRASFETFQRERSLRMDGSTKGRRPLSPMVDDTFLGRQKFEGARSMLRGMVNYLVDNASSHVALADMRSAWAGAMAAPVQQETKAIESAPDTGGAMFSREDQTQTEAFKKWFGDSKVVDSAGKPLVVYHGSGGDITEFSMDAAARSRAAQVTGVPGFYFALSPEVAGDYAFGKDGANVMPSYLALRNPKEVAYAELIGGTFDRASLEAQGHDGLTVKRGGKTWTYIVFRPEQIKSATGNNGDFDGTNPDIRFSRTAKNPASIEAEKAVGSSGRSARVVPVDDPLGALQTAITEVFVDSGNPYAYLIADAFGRSPLSPKAGDFLASFGNFLVLENVQPPVNEGFGDGLVRNAKMLTDLAGAPSFVEKGYSFLDAPTKRKVLLSVGALIHNREILDAVVKLVPVDVMNILRSKKTPTKASLNDQAMLPGGPSLMPDDAITVLIDKAALAAMDPKTIKAAKELSGAGLGNLGGVPDNRLPTNGTGKNGGHGQMRLFGVPNVWNDPEPTRLDAIIYELQDKAVDLKRVQEAIASTGAKIAEKFDARLAETLYPGRVATKAQKFLDTEAKPLLDAMARNNVTMDELGDYLHARHAPERNKQIASINPDLPDGGAGKNSKGELMTTAAARSYIAGLSDSKRMVLAAMARRVDAITKGTTELLVSEGLEKQETIDAWNGAYENYVPLHRDEAESGTTHPTGSGMSVRGSASKRATGSTKQATNILAHVLMQREAAITRAEKNRVAVALYGLAMSNPNPDFWTTIRPSMKPEAIGQELQRMGVDPTVAEAGMRGVPTIKSVDPTIGRVVSRPNPIYKSMPGAIVLKVNGEDRVLMLNVNDPRGLRLAENLKNLDGLTKLDLASRKVGKVTRWMASVNTQWNPAFGLVNLTRDTLGGAINLTSTKLRGKTLKVLAMTPSALVGIGMELSGKKSGEWGRIFRQFQNDGGQTGYREQFKDANDRAKALQSELKALEDAGKLTSQKVAGKILDGLDIFNTTLENAVRLAAYKEALDVGMSRAEAARLGRELTVDFNRKGRMGRELGPLYAFFNASVQGSARTLQTLAGPDGAKIIAGGVGLGVMQAVMLLAAGYDDDEIPEFVKARAFIIPLGSDDKGEKKYFAIPLPLGLHVLPNTGRVLTELTLDGGKDALAKGFDAVGEIAGAFNPLGGGNIFTADGALRTLAPTSVDWLIELEANKNFAGSPIERESFSENDQRPGFERAREGTLRKATGQAYMEVSRIINTLSGGDEYQAGRVSPTPEMLRYLAQVVGGGLLREIEKIINTTVDLSEGKEVKSSGVPVFGRFYGETDDESVQRSRYYDNLRAIEKAEKLVKSAEKKGDYAAADRFEQQYPESMLSKEKNRAAKDLRELNREAMETVDDNEAIKMLDGERTEIMRELNSYAAEIDKPRRDGTLGEALRKALADGEN